MDSNNDGIICLNDNCVLLVESNDPLQSGDLPADSETYHSRIKVRSFSELSGNSIQNPKSLSLPRVCTKCHVLIHMEVLDFFVWQTMDFCSFSCLRTYMDPLLPSQCKNCNKFTMSNAAERFVCRLNGLFVFCSQKCMQSFMKNTRTCLYCQKVTTIGKKLCSITCREKYININVPKTVECFTCRQYKLVKVQFSFGGSTYLLCGEPCLYKLGIKRDCVPVQCNACNNFFDSSEKTHSLRWEESVFNFCSLGCQSYFIALNKLEVKCNSCTHSRYAIDTIIKIDRNLQKFYFCNSLCYYNFVAFISTVEDGSGSEPIIPPNDTSNSCNIPVVLSQDTNSSFQTVPMTVGNNNKPIYSSFIFMMPPHQPEQRNVSTLCRVKNCDKSTQTDPIELKDKLIPIPVYIPTPTFLYTMPVPKPVPISAPYPVPVFIPTTKNSYNDIMKDIAELKSELPDDPQQADLIMMAKAVIEKAQFEKRADENEAAKDMSTPKRNAECVIEDISPASDQMIQEIIGNDDSVVNMMAFSIASSIEDKDVVIVENKDEGINEDRGSVLKTTIGKRAFLEWAKATDTKPSTTDLLKINSVELNSALCSMVKQIRKPNGEEYASDTIYHLCLSIQKYLYINKRHENIFYDDIFKEFGDTLYMKLMQSPIINNPTHIITRVSEELLWESYQLGCCSPYNLLFTLMYYNTKYLNLTAAADHVQLNRYHFIRFYKRVETGEKIQAYKYYGPKQSENGYKEITSEGHSRERNPVALYDFYLQKLPRAASKYSTHYYFKPEKLCLPESPIWFSDVPLESGAIEKMLAFILTVREVVAANIQKL